MGKGARGLGRVKILEEPKFKKTISLVFGERLVIVRSMLDAREGHDHGWGVRIHHASSKSDEQQSAQEEERIMKTLRVVIIVLGLFWTMPHAAWSQ